VHIVVYEFVTGGGWYSAGEREPPASLAAEGRAMLVALAADFAALPDVQVHVLQDRRWRGAAPPDCTVHEVDDAPQELATLCRLAAAADWTVVIAPEFAGHLQSRCQAVERAGGRLLGPSSQVVTLTADKHATAEHLAARGVPAPRGVLLAPGALLPAKFDYPAVLKPRDGAGSQGICRVDGPSAKGPVTSELRLETFCEGTAASVACLCGPRGIVPLAPCAQRLSADGQFTYLGGALPLAGSLAARAARLAQRALATLERPLGYLGVDLVLGDAVDGRDDVAIEINPRLTTSYVGLRALARGNLAAATLATAGGDEVELFWHAGPIQFDAAGRVWREPAGSLTPEALAARSG
jgi:predicted ATP-grasp superfamily ATP-dependent carboligase